MKTARALAALIVTVEPGAEVIAILPSVRAATDYFGRGDVAPDLVFMDIQLSDGLCFDIFREATVPAPVVFCTAYDEYAIEGFKANGIDYILKPFSAEAVSAAFRRWRNMRELLRGKEEDEGGAERKPGDREGVERKGDGKEGTGKRGWLAGDPGAGEFRHLLQALTTAQGKNSFLVFRDSKYSVVATDDIAFFYNTGELPVLYTFDNAVWPVNQSLDTLEPVLPAGKFFRANRQYLIHFRAVKEVEHYFSRKLLVQLAVPMPEKLIVSKEKAAAFLHWLDSR